MEKDAIQVLSEFIDVFNEGVNKIDESVNVVSEIANQFKVLQNLTIPHDLDINEKLDIHKDFSTLFKTWFGIRERIGKSVRRQLDPFFALSEKLAELEETGQEIDIKPIKEILKPALKNIASLGKLYSRKFKPEQDLFIDLEKLPFGEFNQLFKEPIDELNNVFRNMARPLREFRNVFTSLHEFTLPSGDYKEIIQSTRESFKGITDTINNEYLSIKKRIQNIASNLILKQQFGVSSEQELQEQFGEEGVKQYKNILNSVMKTFDDTVKNKIKTLERFQNVAEKIMSRVESGESPLEAYIGEINTQMRDLLTGGIESVWEKNKRFFERIGLSYNRFIELYNKVSEDLIQRSEKIFREDIFTEFFNKASMQYVLSEGEIGGIYTTLSELTKVREVVPKDIIEKQLANASKRVLETLLKNTEEIDKFIKKYFSSFESFGGGALEQISGLIGLSVESENLVRSGLTFEVGRRLLPETEREFIQKYKQSLSQKIIDFYNIKKDILTELGKNIENFDKILGNLSSTNLRDILNYLERTGEINKIPQQLQLQLYSGAQEEFYIESAGIELAFKESGIGSIKQIHNLALKNMEQLQKYFNQFQKTYIYRAGRHIMPIMDIDIDMGMIPQVEPDIGFRMREIKKTLFGGLSPQYFQVIQERLNKIQNILQFEDVRRNFLEQIRNTRRTFETYRNVIDKLTKGETLENIHRYLSDILGADFKQRFPKLETPEQYKEFQKYLAETLKIGSPEALQNVDVLKFRHKELTEGINLLDKTFREIVTGTPTFMDSLATNFKDFTNSFSMFFRFMGQMGSWIMGMPMMSSMWMVSYQPTMASMQVTQPLFAGLGGLTGATLFYQELMGFLYQLPMRLVQVQEQFITMSTLMRSRVLGREALTQAMEIAKWQPIQFEEAVQTITAFTIFPETRTAIRNPEFQRQAMETVQLLSMLVPEQGIEGSIFAIRELLGNQFRSIERRFNISRELLSSFAGVSVEEFKDLPGVEKLRALHKALTEMFAGGEELLLQRGMMFDVQIKNFVDTMIRTLFPPLTMQPQEIVREQLMSMLRFNQGRFDFSIVERLLGTIWERYKYIAERTYKVTEGVPPEKRQQAIEVGAFNLMLSQADTISGYLSVIFSGINNMFSQIIEKTNIGSLLGTFLTRVMSPIGGEGGVLQRWAERIPQIQTPEQARTYLVEFIRDLISGVNESVDEFKLIVNDDKIRQVFKDVADTITNIMISTLEPAMKVATVSGIKLTMMFPRLLGETVIDSFSNSMTDIINTMMGKSMVKGNIITPQNILDFIGTAFTIHGFTSFMRPDVTTPMAFTRLGVGLAIPMIPKAIEDIKEILQGQKITENIMNILTTLGLLTSPFILRGAKTVFGGIRETITPENLFIFNRLRGITELSTMGRFIPGMIALTDLPQTFQLFKNEQTRVIGGLSLFGDTLSIVSMALSNFRKALPLFMLGQAISIGANIYGATQIENEQIKYSNIISSIGGLLSTVGTGLLFGGVSTPIGLGLIGMGGLINLFSPYISKLFIDERKQKRMEKLPIEEIYSRGIEKIDVERKAIEINIEGFINKFGINVKKRLEEGMKELSNLGIDISWVGIGNIDNVKKKYEEIVLNRINNMLKDIENNPYLMEKIKTNEELRNLYEKTKTEIPSGYYETGIEFATRLGLNKKYGIENINQYLIEQISKQISRFVVFPELKAIDIFKTLPENIQKEISKGGEVGEFRSRINELIKLKAKLLDLGINENIITQIENKIRGGEDVNKIINQIDTLDLSNTQKDMLKSYINNIKTFMSIFNKFFDIKQFDIIGEISKYGVEHFKNIQNVRPMLERLFTMKPFEAFTSMALEDIRPPEPISPPTFEDISNMRLYMERLYQMREQAINWLRGISRVLSPQGLGNIMMIGTFAQSVGLNIRTPEGFISPTQYLYQKWMDLNLFALQRPELTLSNPMDIIQRPMFYMQLGMFGYERARELYGETTARKMYSDYIENLFNSVSSVINQMQTYRAPGDILSSIQSITVGSATVVINSATISGSVNIN